MGNQPCLKPESRNTFSSLCSLYHLVSRASESRAVKETQQIKDSLFFLPEILVQADRKHMQMRAMSLTAEKTPQ